MKERESNGIDDEQMRARFAALRQIDSRTEPEFRAMMQRARSDTPRPRRTVAPAWRWTAIAASIIVAAAVLVGKTRGNSRVSTEVSGIPASSDWQSPTAELLNADVRGLMAPPSLLASVFDGVVPPTLQPASE